MSVERGRLPWDLYFMCIAFLVATRSTCARRKVGAVLVKDRRIIATGYNGAPSGFPHCIDDPSRCLRKNAVSGLDLFKCYALHAEENAIIQCAIHGVSCVGAEMYCTHFPCPHCAKMIAQARIRRLVYCVDYGGELRSLAEYFLRNAGVEIVKMSVEEVHEVIPKIVEEVVGARAST